MTFVTTEGDPRTAHLNWHGVPSMHAANDLWTGNNSSDWFDGGNWSLGNPPLITDNAWLARSR